MEKDPSWMSIINTYDKEEIKVDFVKGRGIIYDSNEGSFLFENGFFGKPVGIRKPEPDYYEKMFTLSIFEVLYLNDKNVLSLYKKGALLDHEDIVEVGKKLYSDFLSKFLVYKDLRGKGWIVRPGLKYGADFSIYKYGPHLEHAPLLINVFSKEKELIGIDFVRAGRLATSVKKKWVLALVLNGKTEYLTFQWYRP